jgi:hypothetical protein
MYITYIHPIDGLPRARKVQSYIEAGLVIATLETMGVDPELDMDIDNTKQTGLPLLVSAWDANLVHNMFINNDSMAQQAIQ